MESISAMTQPFLTKISIISDFQSRDCSGLLGTDPGLFHCFISCVTTDTLITPLHPLVFFS